MGGRPGVLRGSLVVFSLPLVTGMWVRREGGVATGAPPGGDRATGVCIVKAPGIAMLSGRNFPVARSHLSRSKSGQRNRCRLSKSRRKLSLKSVWRRRRRATGNAGCLWVCAWSIVTTSAVSSTRLHTSYVAVRTAVFLRKTWLKHPPSL